MSEGVRVMGAATAEEVAAVMAILVRRPGDDLPPDGYVRWRATRRRALSLSAAVDRPK